MMYLILEKGISERLPSNNSRGNLVPGSIRRKFKRVISSYCTGVQVEDHVFFGTGLHYFLWNISFHMPDNIPP